MTPVVAFTAKVPLTFPLRIEKVSGKPCGSVALMEPMTKPIAALSGTLKEDAKTSGGLFTVMIVGVAEEEPLAELEDTPDELADTEAETVAELVAAPVATLDALAETETVTLELVVAVALLVALVNAESEEVLLAESEEVGVADVESKALALAVALTVRDEDTVAELEADWVGATHVDVTLLHQEPGLHMQ